MITQTAKLCRMLDFDLGQGPDGSNRLFGSILPHGTGYRGVCRQARFTDADRFNGDILELFFNSKGKLINERRIASGEDPRLFAFGGHLYAHFVIRRLDQIEWDHWIYDLTEDRAIEIKLPISFNGKNWVPVIGRDRLLLVHTIIPFVSFWFDPQTGNSEVFTKPPYKFSSFTEFRGGAAALWSGDEVTGYGHRTADADRHSPFRYFINPISGAAEFVDIDDSEFTFEGLYVVDPTSMFDGGHIVCCATPKAWTKPQRVVHSLCRIEI